MKKILNWLPLIAILIALALVFYFDLHQYLTFEVLKAHRQQLLAWTEQHYLLTVLSFMSIYILAVALSVPGAMFITLTGGFLFGNLFGTLYVVISATIGATLLFLAVKFALNDWIAQRAANWVIKMRHGFNKNAFQYLFSIRLVPIFPFWVVNIVPALLDVKTKIYIAATFLGIIPGTFVYVTLGNGLGYIFDSGKTPNLKLILEPQILLPLLGLALLSLLPILYKQLRKTNER